VVALRPSDDARATGDVRNAVAHSPTSTTLGVDSFEPSAAPDTFEVQPVAPRVTTAPTTTAPTTTEPVLAPRPASQQSPPTTTRAPDIVAESDDQQLVARLLRVAGVYTNPGDSRATSALASTTEFGTPVVLPVVQQGGDWLRVELPTRPNNSLGWIRARDASLNTVHDRVDVDLTAHKLAWTRDGRVMLQTTVGIGASASPTPPGDFFVTDVLPSSPGSAYGDWIVALNAHSDAYTEFEGGDARIAIHGTNDPSSIGRSVSNGCVRAPPQALASLAAGLAPGTPVIVH
jgi:lipoprotein-anchoring transpeptidase ErfK/SrfK